MGCGCTKTAQAAEKYTYTSPDGKKTTNLSETQARAMQIRGGGQFAKQ